MTYSLTQTSTLYARALLIGAISLACIFFLPFTTQAVEGAVCNTFQDCDPAEACAVGPNNTPSSVLANGQKICIKKDAAAINAKYGAVCTDDSECPVGTTCNITPPQRAGTCDVEDPRDVPTGNTTVAPGTGGTATTPTTVGNGNTAGSGALQTAQSTGFGTNTLSNTGLFDGSTDTLFIGLVRQVFIFIGALLVVMIGGGGILYMVSAGDSNTLNKAKAVITTGIIGAIIAFAAYIIAELVIRVITASGPVA